MWGLAHKAEALRLGVQAPLGLGGVDTEELPVGGCFPEDGGVMRPSRVNSMTLWMTSDCITVCIRHSVFLILNKADRDFS
jgi:hypothetical protein